VKDGHEGCCRGASALASMRQRPCPPSPTRGEGGEAASLLWTGMLGISALRTGVTGPRRNVFLRAYNALTDVKQGSAAGVGTRARRLTQSIAQQQVLVGAKDRSARPTVASQLSKWTGSAGRARSPAASAWVNRGRIAPTYASYVEELWMSGSSARNSGV
jgi:hypothetical protein